MLGQLLLYVGCFIGTTLAHVALTYPPARKYDLDFLDNGRTKAPCGMPKGDLVTSLPAASGAMINVTWHLAYPHRGGFKLELLDQNDRYLMDLTPTNANTDYVGSDDTTAQSYTVSFPESLTCRGCTLRLLRQAQEWGNQYLFWSCADVDIVPVTELTTVCSGHGKTNANGQCQCDHLYSGVVCQYKDECWNDNDCGLHGKCINIDATTYPKRQCYCEIGWFGDKCSKESPVKDVNIDASIYNKRELSNDFTLLWRILPESDEIEAVMRIKGTNYAAIGWRPHGITQSCKSFPIVQNKNISRGLETTPRHVPSESDRQNVPHNTQSKHVLKSHPEPESKAEPESKEKTIGKAEPEPELSPNGKSEPEPNAESKAEPEPKTEGKAEPEPKTEGKAEPEPKAEGKAEPEPKPEPKTEGKAEPEPKAEGKSEPEPKTEGKVEPEPKAEGKAEPEPKPEGKAEPEPKAESKAEPEPKAEGKVEPEPKAEGKAEPEPKAEGKAEPEPKSESTAEPEPKPEDKVEPEPKAESKAEPKTESKAEPEPNSTGKPEPDSKVRHMEKSEHEGTGKAEPEPKTVSEPEPQSHLNKETHHKINTDIHSKAEPESTAEPSSKTESVQEHKIVLSSQPSSSIKFVDHTSHDLPLNVRARRQVTIRTSDFILKEPLSVPSTEPEPVLNKKDKNVAPEPLPETSSEPASVPEQSKFNKHSTLADAHGQIKSSNLEHSKPEPKPETEPEPESQGESAKNNNIAMHNYPERSPYTPRADFHAMDCTDIVIGMAHGSLSRIQDFYTRDRSTPRIDSFFGGKDDITAALGYEVDGLTTILFRKKLKAMDLTDHTITDSIMDVIWARGQEPNMYIHSPTTGLEAGKAKIKNFYRPDELKYHGHGNQRGKLTLNFFEEKKTRVAEQSDCQGEWKYPANCQEKQCEYSVKWKFLDTTDEISFTITSIHTDRWTGIGFSKDQRMPHTDAIIGWVDHIGRATILDVWMNNYVAPKLDKSQDIYNISGERKNGVTTLHFVRKRFTIDFDNDIHFSDTDCPYIMFPVKGGTFNAISKKIGKHEITPIISKEKVCIRKCQIGGLNHDLSSKPEPKSEPESEPGVKVVPEPTAEPKPKTESIPRTVGEPEPKSVGERNFISSCLGEWKSPPNCEGHKCEYKANWFYLDETDEIIFTISSKSYNKWTGIGFSKNRAMTETDAVIGWIEETGRSFIMDTWLESYSPPILDSIQNIHNASGQRVDGMTVLQFVRKRGTNDMEKDLQFTNGCLYFIFPVHGGVFNAVNKKIRKHESTPIVSSKKICIQSCRSKVAHTTVTTQPTTERIQTSTHTEIFTTKHRVTVDSTSKKTSLLVPTTQSTINYPSSKYAVEVKLRQAEKSGLKNKKSQQYRTLQKQLLQEMNAALQNLDGLQELEFAGFESDETEQNVIARMHVTLLDKLPLKEGRKLHTDEPDHKSADLHSILNSTVNTGRLGNLPVDPAYLNIISLAAVQDRTPHENAIEQESNSKELLTDEQVKIYIIISGVLALVFLVIVQAACMIYRDRRAKRGSHTKEKLLNNSHWRDYSVTASSNYSYENFAMQDDENKISKHPIGSVSNGSGLSKGSASSQPTNGLGLPRVGPPDRMLPRNTGYSATFERMAMRRNNGPTNTSVPPSYATHDRSLRSMSGAHSQQELRPDFYFMPHQRRYSGEVVRVFVDYNNPEYTGK